MNRHRSAARWFAGLMVAGTVVVGGLAPAQADTGWNGTKSSTSTTVKGHHFTPTDTGWNGT